MRALTVVTQRVRAGDLTARSGIQARDEVGALASAFDDMTGSLEALTGELRQAADLQAALRARLQTVIGSMADGLVSTDAAGCIDSVNPAAAALLGVSAEQAVGRSLDEVAVRADGAGWPVADDGVADLDLLLLRPDGTPVPVRAVLTAIRGGESGRVVVLRDMTREREVERMKTEFLSNISHELRTPLTPIRGYAEILRRKPDQPPERVGEFAATIVDSSIRMNRVVDLLVDVAALEARQVRPAPRETSVAAFADRLLADWRARYPERAADLRRRVAGGLPPVEIDPDWVAKALTELVDNAVKYTPPGTPVTLLATRLDDGNEVRLSVRDAGPGFDPASTPGLLGDFAQADASATRSVGGLGLGLGFVRRVAEAFGLTLHVSSAPGEGAEFALDVPVAAPGAAPPTRRATRLSKAAARAVRHAPSSARRRHRPPPSGQD